MEARLTSTGHLDIIHDLPRGSFRCLNRAIRLNLQTNLDTEAQYWKLKAVQTP